MPAANGLEAIAKLIRDVDVVVGLVRKTLSPAVPWQRKLIECLDETSTAVQVLRMTVAMERSYSEILAAAAKVHAASRRALLATAGTRAEAKIKASLTLVAQQAGGISALLQHIGSSVQRSA